MPLFDFESPRPKTRRHGRPSSPAIGYHSEVQPRGDIQPLLPLRSDDQLAELAVALLRRALEVRVDAERGWVYWEAQRDPEFRRQWMTLLQEELELEWGIKEQSQTTDGHDKHG